MLPSTASSASAATPTSASPTPTPTAAEAVSDSPGDFFHTMSYDNGQPAPMKRSGAATTRAKQHASPIVGAEDSVPGTSLSGAPNSGANTSPRATCTARRQRPMAPLLKVDAANIPTTAQGAGKLTKRTPGIQGQTTVSFSDRYPHDRASCAVGVPATRKLTFTRSIVRRSAASHQFAIAVKTSGGTTLSPTKGARMSHTTGRRLPAPQTVTPGSEPTPVRWRGHRSSPPQPNSVS